MLFFRKLFQTLHPELIAFADFIVLLPEFAHLIGKFRRVVRRPVKADHNSGKNHAERNQCRCYGVRRNERHYRRQPHHGDCRHFGRRRQQKIPGCHGGDGYYRFQIRSSEQRSCRRGKPARLVQGNRPRCTDSLRRRVGVSDSRCRRGCGAQSLQGFGHPNPAGNYCIFRGHGKFRGSLRPGRNSRHDR